MNCGSGRAAVPFKGGADNMNALLGGHIDVTTDSTGWAELVNAGKFRLLVTWGAERTKNLPTEGGGCIVNKSNLNFRPARSKMRVLGG